VIALILSHLMLHSQLPPTELTRVPASRAAEQIDSSVAYPLQIAAKVGG
jgi:hypothetical protein